MKKHFYSLFAATAMMLAVTSCSQEEDFAPSSGEMTTFSVSLNGAVGSRTIGDGKTAKSLYYEVYHGTECIIDQQVTFGEGVVNHSIDLPLLKGEKYDIIFWAQAADGSIYDATNLKTISVDYGTDNTVIANQEKYDAFYNALNQFEADGKVHTIELRRPFAQLNLGTSDWERAKDGLPMVDDGNGGTKKQYPVTHTKAFVKGLATTFSPLTGEASGTTDVTFDYEKLPASTFDVTVNGTTTVYKYLSLNYLLVPGQKAPQGLGEHDVNGNKTNVDIEFTLKRGENELFTLEVPNAPIQRNWRTNVIGDLLTGNRFEVVIKPEPDGDNNVDIKNIKGLDALNQALNSNQSTEPVIYDISGLSTTDNVTIEIPNTFKAAQVTFNLNDIKDDAELTIKDGDSGSYAGTVCVSIPTTDGHSLTKTTITLPSGHVELLAGNFGNGTVETSPTTLVVTEGVSISSLTVNGGNVEIQTGGEVKVITVSETVDTPIIVALGEGVAIPQGADDENIILAGADNAVSNEETVYVAQVGKYKYTSLEDALTVITAEGTIKMLADYVDVPSFTIPAGKNITLDLNGFTIEGTDETEKNYGLIQNNGILTVTGNGTLKLNATKNSGWNRYSAVISNNPGATLTVESGTIEHLGGTDMAYGIDNLTNGGIGDVNATINGGTIKSTYRAIRQFLNSDSKQNNLIINGGSVVGANKGIFFHDPSKKANNGKLVVGENAKVGSVYLFVTEGSTHWPVEVSIAKSAVDEDGITSANVPEGYKVVEENNVITIINYYNIKNLASLKYFGEVVNGGKDFKGVTVSLEADIDLNNEQWTSIGTSEKMFKGIFDGKNHTIKNLSIIEEEAKEGKAYTGFFGYAKDVTIKNVTFENINLNIACLDIDHSQGHIGAVAGSLEGTSTIENVTVKGDIKVEATITANGASRVAVVAGGNSSGNVTMKNVHVQANPGSYLKANNNVGALAGQLQEKSVFENCSSNIDVTGTKFFAGGIIGLAAGNQTFTDCHTTGNVTITAGREGKAHDHYRVGGIAGGWADGAKNVLTITNCSYTGKLSGTNADGSVAESLDYAGYVGRGYTLNGCAGSEVIIDNVSYVQKYNSADKAGIYIIDGVTPVFTADELIEALEKPAQFKGVKLMNDIKIDPANMSNAYGTTGINVKYGQSIDGNGYTLDIKGAGGTWDSGINTTGGLIKNITVTGSFRGIFINHNSDHHEKVVLENVTIEGTTYTISCDQGTNSGFEATNSTFKGWTSYAATLGNAKFTNCNFGEGNGYAYCRPYAPTEFVGCKFEGGFGMDAVAQVSFENCTIGGVALTVDNLATLVTSNTNNATVK